MTLRTIFITAAITSVAVLGTIGSASAGKAKFERTKPHVNVGTIGHVFKRKQRRTVMPQGVATAIPAYQDYVARPTVAEQELLIFVTPRITRPTQ